MKALAYDNLYSHLIIVIMRISISLLHGIIFPLGFTVSSLGIDALILGIKVDREV
jgi:hypothetical protein